MCNRYALLFVGAVIGAGFASGREVFSFFTQYGHWSWPLILITASVMTLLCFLCHRGIGEADEASLCRDIVGHRSGRCLSGISILLLDAVMGGAMISAAGHIAALAVPCRGAYLLGVAVTIGLAFLLGRADTKPMMVLSALLAAIHVTAVVAVMLFDRGEITYALPTDMPLAAVLGGGVGSVAYAALNMTLALGVIGRCTGLSCRVWCRTAAIFGLWMTGLLFFSNFLYLKHPELNEAAFPMVVLLSRFGGVGYVASLFVMYLAILTTLSAVLLALRNGMEQYFPPKVAVLSAAALTLLLSLTGFEELVQRWYTPAGILCLCLVFLPMLKSHRKIS